VRATLFFLVALGCNRSAPTPDAGIDLAGPCGSGCPQCDAGEVCISGDHTPVHRVECVRLCDVTPDCPMGLRCANLSWHLGTPPVCVSATVPSPCLAPALPCHERRDNTYCDGDVLQRFFNEAANRTCGYERTRCPNGCEGGHTDGGYTPARWG
jgi:hypothetical protein